jgi:hypothetical protein
MTGWASLERYGDTFTCYSAAMAAWVAQQDESWAAVLNPGLWLVVAPDGHDRLAFAHFPPGLRSELGLRRTGALQAGEARDGVLAELERSGRVIVAGDGFNLPWHVAHRRRHVPHWFVLAGSADAPIVVDPFAATNELGVQTATNRTLEATELPALLPALPRDDRVLALREILAFGDVTQADDRPWQWFVRDGAGEVCAPEGPSGPDAVLELARHFRARGQDPDTYAQSDDVWSIARHRAFLVRHVADRAELEDSDELRAWAQEHGEPLVKRWGHMAPLLMQARLSLTAGREASDSVPRTLEDLAGREQAAAGAFPIALDAGSI